MMYLSIKNFNIYDQLDSNNNYLLIIKNKTYLYSFLNNMKSANYEKEFIQIFDESNKQVNNLDFIEFIPSIFYMDVNNKKNLNILLKILKNNCKEELRLFVESFSNELEILFKKINFESPIEIESDIEIEDNDLLKLLNISIKDNDDNILEKVINFIKISNELRKIKLFVFYNLLSFLSFEEIDILLNNCKNLHVMIIDIEYNEQINNSFEVIKILDDDLCLLEKI